MSALPEAHWTVESYLAFERQSEIKHEFLNGEIYDLTGASPNHVFITGNTFASLHTQLRKQPCRIYSNDMRVRVSAGHYTYPDIIVVCGEPQSDKDNGDNLLNPTLIIEVLSPSTEGYDRGDKFGSYRGLESLQEYVLIAQDKYQIEHYVRQSEGGWLFSDASKPEDVVVLPSINCTLLLSDVYEKVTFEEETE
jgi:Uma2 family endonuclease